VTDLAVAVMVSRMNGCRGPVILQLELLEALETRCEFGPCCEDQGYLRLFGGNVGRVVW